MLPSLFVPHGSPPFALQPGLTGLALAQAAADLPHRPRAIVVASAHWDSDVPRVGAAARPETIHDFWGFPEPLYDLRYPSPGAPELAAEIGERLGAAGFAAESDAGHGLDHAVWIPLRVMFPDAGIPVVPLSIQNRLGPDHHYRLGQALAPLLAQDVLVIGSGNLTHNLRDYQLTTRAGSDLPYVREFADWIWERLEAQDLPALLDYRARAPHAVRAHPTEEHLLPFFVALGAAGQTGTTSRLHASVAHGMLAMDAFAFRNAPGTLQ